MKIINFKMINNIKLNALKIMCCVNNLILKGKRNMEEIFILTVKFVLKDLKLK